MEKETPEENLNQACVRVLKEMTKETPKIGDDPTAYSSPMAPGAIVTNAGTSSPETPTEEVNACSGNQDHNSNCDGFCDSLDTPPTEDWEEADLFVDIAPEASHKIVNYPGRLNARLMLKGKDVGGLKELLTSHDAELARKIEGTLLTILVRSGDRKTLDEYIRRDAVLALLGKKNV